MDGLSAAWPCRVWKNWRGSAWCFLCRVLISSSNWSVLPSLWRAVRR